MPSSGPPERDDLTRATDQLAAVVKAFLSDESVSTDLAKAAYCEAMQTMRACAWSAERSLAYCKRVTTVQARSIGYGGRIEKRRQWLGNKVVTWLIECYFGR